MRDDLAVIPLMVAITLEQIEKQCPDYRLLEREDVREILTQIFDHFLNTNRLTFEGFVFKPEMLRSSLTAPASGKPIDLNQIANSLLFLVFQRLTELNFQKAIEIQGGWYYGLHDLYPNSQLILRNFNPSIRKPL